MPKIQIQDDDAILDWFPVYIMNTLPGLLMRPEKDEAKTEARKCEVEAEVETEAKNFLWGRGQNIWGQGRGRGHSV